VKPAVIPNSKHIADFGTHNTDPNPEVAATPWPLDYIRTTQTCVGWREVVRKQRQLRADEPAPGSNRITPVVLGPSFAAYAFGPSS
jgi:hypothetical protein